ncbi:MAG: enoyl-CoA hydratase [Alphaproteobacteria bacterium]|jgi:enoyl-CoA hydratase/carnithine racemase|nr:enoyl-CoA hydratase [Alphaproteobacteria bacterium]
MSYQDILTSTEDGILTVTLNRPDKLNAWTGQMQDEVKDAIMAAGEDDSVRCIVVTGAGRGFCAGADMAGLQQISPGGEAAEAATSGGAANGDAAREDIESLYPGRFGYMYACPKPIIAAINGACAGIGLIFTLYADMRIASADAKFTTAFAQRGLIAEHGIAWLLPRLVGEAHALDLLFTARVFRGEEAERVGLVNRALPANELMPHVMDVAGHLATQVSPRSVAVMKRQIRASYFQSFARSLEVADQEMAGSFASFDFKEGVDSFVEKRPPAFEGR